MNRLIIIGALAVLLGVVCNLGMHTTLQYTDNMIQKLSNAKSVSISGDYNHAQELCKQMKEDWQGCHEVLCTFMPHSRLEAIDQTLSTLPELCETNSIEQFYSECDRGAVQLEYLKESEVPTLQNLF